MKQKLVVIVGPTAVGKTKLSIDIAKQFNGEIISGDSMQVYKGMDIGTAKVKEDERKQIQHYMIDIKEPHEPFTTAEFQKMVRNYIDLINDKKKLPIIVGGSGLYIQSVLYDYNFSMGKRDETITKELEKRIEKDGIMSVYKELQTVDPVQANKIHPNNHRRVIRALEIYLSTGKTMTQLQEKQSKSTRYDAIVIGLQMERSLLYERINHRVDEMIEEGLVNEVKSLYERGLENTQSMRGIGYKELIPYIKNEKPLEQCVEELKRNSRRYAKRQYTWFKNKMDVHWYTIEPHIYHKTFTQIYFDLNNLL